MNSDGIARPNPALTPGAAVPGVSVEQVCAPGYASTSRNPGLLDEQSVFQLYLLDYPAGLSGHRVDRLIPSELGGADTLPNLWPEPTTPQTAGRKDQLAGWLHQLVCSGAVPLETAQRQVADDWYAAWLRYGGTNSPAPDTLTAVGAPRGRPGRDAVGRPEPEPTGSTRRTVRCGCRRCGCRGRAPVGRGRKGSGHWRPGGAVRSRGRGCRNCRRTIWPGRPGDRGRGAVAAGLDLPHAVTVGEDDTATDYAGAHHDASPADDGVPHSDSNPGHPADSTDF